MTRIEFQTLADRRARDAEVLFSAGRHDAAYYLAGYAVECALKACVAKRFQQDDIPDPKFVREIYTHDLAKLFEQAGVRQYLQLKSPIDVSWSLVRDWSEQTRYKSTTTSQEAAALIQAIVDPNNGVLPWLKNYW